MARSLALAVAVLIAACCLPAHAQRRARSFVTALALDVIGPRSTASVRAALRTHDGDLAACRSNDDALVRISLAIAPDGSILSATSDEDPDLDRDATDCVLRAATAWRFRGGATSVTTVSWSFRLHGASADATAAGRTCWCFHWVHGGDHGRDCTTTRAACDQGRHQRGASGDYTECESVVQPTCEREGYVDGQHMRLP